MQSTPSHSPENPENSSGSHSVQSADASSMQPVNLTDVPLVVVNVGLSGFAAELSAQQVQVTSVDWQPPAHGDAELARLLALLDS